MNENRFRDLVSELALENPLAIRPLLRILAIRFTDAVPTLAVTNEDRPLLLVNLAFVSKHCRTEAHVKAVILHELLHVILRHTEKRGPITDAEHIAADAVINAIIHRQVGAEASSMMSGYYRHESGLMKLLRPCEKNESLPGLDAAWNGLYEGRLVVDDVRELAQEFERSQSGCAQLDRGRLLGNHEERPGDLGEIVSGAVDASLRAMNGGGIWRSPFAGPGGAAAEAFFAAADTQLAQWKRRTIEILRRHVVPDARSRALEAKPLTFTLPVLTAGDRRAFVRSLWSPFLPDAVWKTEVQTPTGTTNVYLDVSGSMWAEMPHVVALLRALRRHIRMPFWSFSTEVQAAVIRGGRLETQSTGGTSIKCVLRHIAATKPSSAVIVTDGYIEEVERSWLKGIGRTRVHAVITRDGSTALLDRAGIPATQLERLP